MMGTSVSLCFCLKEDETIPVRRVLAETADHVSVVIPPLPILPTLHGGAAGIPHVYWLWHALGHI